MNKKERRRESIKKRKNFAPALAVTLLIWIILSVVILFIDPSTPGIIYLFFIMLFFGIFFPASLLFGKTRQGVLLALSVTFFLVLRYFQIGNIINFILIIGVFIVTEIYFLNK